MSVEHPGITSIHTKTCTEDPTTKNGLNARDQCLHSLRFSRGIWGIGLGFGYFAKQSWDFLLALKKLKFACAFEIHSHKYGMIKRSLVLVGLYSMATVH